MSTFVSIKYILSIFYYTCHAYFFAVICNSHSSLSPNLKKKKKEENITVPSVEAFSKNKGIQPKRKLQI
jgi:hypothetical protein